MRIIAGNYKSQKLKVPEGQRPSTGRLREALFSSLDSKINFEESTVLDLFSGSGSLGIESLSRGASFAFFVDNSKESVSCLQQNLSDIDTQNYQIVCSTVKDFLLQKSKQLTHKFSLVFSDPPYDKDPKEQTLLWLLESNMLKKDAIIVLESRSSKIKEFETNDKILDKFSLIKETKYGDSQLKLYQYLSS